MFVSRRGQDTVGMAVSAPDSRAVRVWSRLMVGGGCRRGPQLSATQNSHAWPLPVESPPGPMATGIPDSRAGVRGIFATPCRGQSITSATHVEFGEAAPEVRTDSRGGDTYPTMWQEGCWSHSRRSRGVGDTAWPPLEDTARHTVTITFPLFDLEERELSLREHIERLP